ncbi:MAG: dihydrofolate reductase family protein [Corynebacterium casei]|nr:dihydrofolate reductase family protein [Corynebacterium casei]
MTDSAFTPLPQSSPLAADIIGPDPDPSTPHVRFVEVSTLSGSAAVSGNSGAMGNKLDTEVLLGIRERSDVIVVGSRTVLEEDYGGAQPTKNRSTPPPIAVITNSFNVDVSSKFITEAITSPLVIANDDALNDPGFSAKRQALLDAGVEFINSGTGTAKEIVEQLSKRGLHKIDCEGGPGIFGLFIADNAIDQMYLTLDPQLTPTVEKNLVSDKAASAVGVPTDANLRMRLEKVAVDTDSTVFLRYEVAPTT